jgi:uncharacterized protein
MGSTTVIDLRQIAKQLGLPEEGVLAAVQLIDEGNTVPFITRYRRDQTNGLDELQLRSITNAVVTARQLADRKQTILRTIEGQGKLIPELRDEIHAAENTKVLEDLYLPFKPKRLSLAEQAKQKRLEPLAQEIITADSQAADLEKRAADFVDDDSGVASAADALLGVGHIIADLFSSRADVRQRLRKLLFQKGRLRSLRIETPGKALTKTAKHFRDYFDFDEHLQKVPPHRVLAMNRGERAKILRVRVEGPTEEIQTIVEELVVPADHPHIDFLKACCRDALSRLILPSLEREVRREMTDASEEHAIAVFARNLRNLLLQPPVAGRVVLAIDPGFKSGCKAVVLDSCGNPLARDILHIVGKAEQKTAAAARIVELVREHSCNVIAVGNGTAGREVESLLSELIVGDLQEHNVAYVIVNEAGASVYSTSQYAREELPDFEAAYRGAVSIGRRLLDPLSELVKIEPANIGVGLYQHDVKARHLHASLDAVVEGCVNYVGVDVNTASPALLRYVAGLNQAVAKGIIDWRAAKGPFTSREQFREVPGFGDAAYVQAVGFLKISEGTNPLDATRIHPESYQVAEKVLKEIDASSAELVDREKHQKISDAVSKTDLASMADELGVGRLLLADIVEQFLRPGRDPREDLPEPLFKQGVLKFEDLEVGMELRGSVLNVVDFGAFIDIGLHDSGLVHVSQLSSGYIRDPYAAVVVGQAVKVWVLELDKNRRRVALTMIRPGSKPVHGANRERPQNSKKKFSENSDQKKSAERKGPPSGRGHRKPGSGPRKSKKQDRGPRTYTSRPDRKTKKPLTDEMKAGQAPLRTFGDLKQFFDIKTGTDESADKKDLKKKKPKQEVQEVDSVEAEKHSASQDLLGEPFSARSMPKEGESTSAGTESTAKPSSLHNSNKDVSEELDEKASSQLPDAAAPTLEQQPAKDSSKDTSQQ